MLQYVRSIYVVTKNDYFFFFFVQSHARTNKILSRLLTKQYNVITSHETCIAVYAVRTLWLVFVLSHFHLQESLAESHVQRADRPRLLPLLFQIVNGPPSAHRVIAARPRFVVVVAVDASQPLEVLHDDDRLFVQKTVVGQVFSLPDLTETPVKQNRCTYRVRGHLPFWCSSG